MKPLQSARVRISFVAVLGVALALTTSAAHATTITFDDGNYTTNYAPNQPMYQPATPRIRPVHFHEENAE